MARLGCLLNKFLHKHLQDIRFWLILWISRGDAGISMRSINYIPRFVTITRKKMYISSDRGCHLACPEIVYTFLVIHTMISEQSESKCRVQENRSLNQENIYFSKKNSLFRMFQRKVSYMQLQHMQDATPGMQRLVKSE